MNPIENDIAINLILAAHPVICLLHIGIKGAAIVFYLFMKLATKSTIHTFIVVIIIASIDFWFTKNISGRYLVGLRWWNGDDDDGENGWQWEHDDLKIARSDIDKNVFWYGIFFSTGFWFVMLVIKTLAISLFWGMLVAVCFSLSFTNLYAYYKCNSEYKNHIEKMISMFSDLKRTSQNIINATMS